MDTNDEIENESLSRLASQAEAEDEASREEEQKQAEGEVVDYDEKEAALKAAQSVVHGMAVGAKMVLHVEYPEEVKQEGVEKLAPCFEGGVMPAWMARLLGRYGKYIEAGCWFGGVAFGTYQTLQARKAEEEAKQAAREGSGDDGIPMPFVAQAEGETSEGFSTEGVQ